MSNGIRITIRHMFRAGERQWARGRASEARGRVTGRARGGGGAYMTSR